MNDQPELILGTVIVMFVFGFVAVWLLEKVPVLNRLVKPKPATVTVQLCEQQKEECRSALAQTKQARLAVQKTVEARAT